MTKFVKPGSVEQDYPDMAREAGTKALADAGLEYSQLQSAFVGWVYGETTAGQRAVYELGLTGIPVLNVNNACATGSSALYLARDYVRGGLADCVLALGFEKMERGSLVLGAKFPDRAGPQEKHIAAMHAAGPIDDAPVALQMFGSAGREHMQQYGSTPEHFAWIGWKNHHHSVNNPYAQFQRDYSMDEILGSTEFFAPLTKLQCSPTSDGSAAAILASEKFVVEHGLQDRAVEIVGQAMITDFASTFGGSAIKMVGSDLSREAARQALGQAQLAIEDVQVVELHDCFSTNELLTYEALGMAAEGQGHLLVEKADTTYGGRWVVNPSGGLISKGHPLGATGLAQCAELTWQLRGDAGARQVADARAGLQHNIGLGGAAVVTVYQKAF
jgi:acetyl-CoA acyltransferase